MHTSNLITILQVTHTLSVSLNKIGDLKYYEGDLQAARSCYSRSLDVRRNAIKDRSNVSSQVIKHLSCCHMNVPVLGSFSIRLL